MAGNSIGTVFRVTTFGESHGVALGAVIDGCPAGLSLSVSDIQRELDRRRPGQSRVTTARAEKDECEILSGVFEGKTLGTPIAVIVRNKGHRSGDYDSIKDVFRPGTADFTYYSKYGVRDYRGGGRASGRETIGRVIGGAVARKLLALKGIAVVGHVVSVGDVRASASSFDEKEIERNVIRCADKKAALAMEKAILSASSSGDSLGGVVEVIVRGVSPGLGEPVFGRLDAELSGALMSIGAVKGVEVGAGFSAASLKGSQCNDSYDASGLRKSNNSGGIDGGMSNGSDIVLRAAVKPTPSVSLLQKMPGVDGKMHDVKIEGRHDPCICPRIVPVCEAMAAIVLADHVLRNKVSRIDML